MGATFLVRVKDSTDAWSEEYDARRFDVTNQEEAEQAGREFVDKFNSTLRRDEEPRKFISAEYLENKPDDSNPDSLSFPISSLGLDSD